MLELPAEPVEDDLGPLLPVGWRARARHLVGLGGKTPVLNLTSQEPEHPEELVGLFDVAT